ncbi:MAG: hypothetical protein QNK05_06375 [Myxococcota bacterium]|nr:hypothetical protein [Myxococcota bacterium]
MKRVGRGACGFLLTAALLAPTALDAEEPAESMAEVYAAISVLLPLSVQEQGFAPAEARSQATLAFARLERASQALLDHSEGRDAEFFALSRGLAADAELARWAFEMGRLEEARFQVHLLTSHCVDCHSRLPAADSGLAGRLFQRAELAELRPTERARLQTATRRFDDARASWEQVFADPAIPPIEMDASGWLSDYLRVSLRVKRDPARAARALAKLAERGDTPRYLVSRIATWRQGLAKLEPEKPGDPRARAIALAKEGRDLADPPTSTNGLVHDLAASSLLLEWIDARVRGDGPDPDLELAEAWFLLGQIEDRTAHGSWVPRSEVYMEAAIRAAPDGPRARAAFERVEETLLMGYGADGVSMLPRRERERLEELAAMVPASP